MLSRLHVKNYVLIDSLEIEFPKGLVIYYRADRSGKVNSARGLVSCHGVKG